MFTNLLNVIDFIAIAIVAILDLLKGMVEAVVGSGYVGGVLLIVFFFLLLAGPLYFYALKKGVA